MEARNLKSLIATVVVVVALGTAAAGMTGDRERAKRQSSVSIPWLIDCADSIDCIFKITEFATYR